MTAGWDSRHNQGLETVVHPCDLVLQLLIRWKPEQLADNDDAWVGNCSDVLDQHPQLVDNDDVWVGNCSDVLDQRPQLVDQHIGFQVTDVVLANVQKHNDGGTSKSWLKLAVDPPTVIIESHSGTTSRK